MLGYAGGCGLSDVWSRIETRPRHDIAGRIMTTVDTIRAVFTYLIALIVVAGGGAVIYLSRADAASADTVAIMAGFIGAALAFVFSSETQTRTARQTSTATREGVIAHANGITSENTRTPSDG